MKKNEKCLELPDLARKLIRKSFKKILPPPPKKKKKYYYDVTVFTSIDIKAWYLSSMVTWYLIKLSYHLYMYHGSKRRTILYLYCNL